jgi:hypothetical protein
MDHITDAATWAATTFRHSDLGDVRRHERLVAVAAAMAKRPGASLPDVFPDWADLKAAYRLMGNSSVHADDLLVGPTLHTAARAAACSVVLLVGDGTELDLSAHPSTRFLGHIGDSHARGLMVHTVLAVDGHSRQVLGVAAQRAWIRRAFKHTEQTHRRDRAARRRESQVWAEWTAQALDVLRAVPEPPKRLLAVGDRGSDLFDFLVDCDARDCGFVLRAAQDRALDADECGAGQQIHDLLESAPVRIVTTVQVPARAGQPARAARVELRAVELALKAPQGAHTQQALPVRVVEVKEVEGPRTGKALHWRLLSSEPIETERQILQVVEWYTARWLVEEFHMGLKTGCAIETRQLKSGHAFRNLLALCSPIAVELLRLRCAARTEPSVPATEVLTPTQIQVLRALRPKLSARPTAHEALRWVANLGGFLMRTGDGEPGWRLLWRGFQKLRLAEVGFNLATRSG